jgi:hypothetical protein
MMDDKELQDYETAKVTLIAVQVEFFSEFSQGGLTEKF